MIWYDMIWYDMIWYDRVGKGNEHFESAVVKRYKNKKMRSLEEQEYSII